MTISVIENVRGYLGSRPPLVVFMIFLGSMAVGLITFAYFVSDMPKAAVDQDFKTFMDRLSVLNFCVAEERGGAAAPGNASSQSAVMGTMGEVGRGSYLQRWKRSNSLLFGDRSGEEMAAAASAPTVPPSPSAAISSFVVNVTVMMRMEIAVPPTSAAYHNSTVISTSVWASQLRRLDEGQDVEANVSIMLYPFGQHPHPCPQGRRGRCFTASACVSLTAPRHFFPQALRLDPMTQCQGDLGLEGENRVHGEVVVDPERCLSNASSFGLQQLHAPSGQGVIAMDRSAMNLHLMHSSYFLFVMVISLFCYAIIRGRPSKVKIIHTQSCSDKHALIQA
ncbi:hypothetical protein ACOMHN_051191 [Nucella lapillus]